MTTTTNGHIEVLHRDECVRLLLTQAVGRVVVVDHGRPHVVPVNYALDGDAVVFRTAAGTTFEAVTRSTVAFEIDHLDHERHEGWSVVVHGIAQEVTEYDSPELVRRIAGVTVEPWAGGARPHVIRIAPHTITGRRVVGPATAQVLLLDAFDADARAYL